MKTGNVPQGWHPSGRYLVILEMVGVGTPHFGLLPTDGDKIEWLPQLPMDKEYATQVDEQLLVEGRLQEGWWLPGVKQRQAELSIGRCCPETVGGTSPDHAVKSDRRPGEG